MPGRHGKSHTRTVPAGSQVPPADLPSPSDVVLSDVSGATALDMTEVVSSDLVTQLNDAARSPRFWPWCLALTIALVYVSPLVLLAGVPMTVWLFWKDQVRRKVVAFYDVHGEEEARHFQRLVDAFGQASEAQRAWHVVASGAVSTTHQHKVHAGATALINRLPVVRGISGPPNLTSNITVRSLSTPRRSVYFLPDRILIRDGKHYADVAHRDSRAEAVPQRFIEDGVVPSDSEIVGHTWQYVNVKGGLDRRFKNNRQLPILRYGRLTLTGEAGYHAIFDFSTTAANSALAGALQNMATAEQPGPRNRAYPGGGSPPKDVSRSSGSRTTSPHSAGWPTGSKSGANSTNTCRSPPSSFPSTRTPTTVTPFGSTSRPTQARRPSATSAVTTPPPIRPPFSHSGTRAMWEPAPGGSPAAAVVGLTACTCTLPARTRYCSRTSWARSIYSTRHGR